MSIGHFINSEYKVTLGKSKSKKNQKSILAFFVVLILIVAVVYVLCIWLPQEERTAFKNHYLGIMKNLNSTETKTKAKSWFERHYNFTELYGWVHEKLDFVPVNETFERHTDPSKILESGKGRCEEFSILYVATCLAHSSQSRIVIAVDVSNPINWVGQHVWAEVKLDNHWVHVDPSDKIWNDPYMYEAWIWGKGMGSKIKIYAFEDGKYEDVTLNYKRGD